ncbi:hypothetical protein NDU88_005051 [Pleurodeles waltl]|uniref:Uncharacterized protein n=1 Tax=Pleurodeles waltl TaxID=8319 RepID=A0AAV7TA81_PLEWA|nr:hypothetical protein NDU88_005051 [Pleurodeles waltl]
MGMLRTTSATIAEIFATYYKRVYATMTSWSGENCANNLKDLTLPTLSDEDRATLEQDLTTEEIAKAIGDL